MNYREEIVKMVNKETQESILRVFYSLLKAVTSDPDGFRPIMDAIERLFGAE